MESKIFSYKVEGITLGPLNDNCSVSPAFDKKELFEKIRVIFKADDFKVDEQSLNFKIEGGQLYVQGLVVKHDASRSIGFMKSN